MSVYILQLAEQRRNHTRSMGRSGNFPRFKNLRYNIGDWILGEGSFPIRSGTALLQIFRESS